jgi:ABC-2 type transport system permease protein
MTDARILDRGYRPYDGPRLGPAGAVRSLARHTAQRVMGLKRPAAAKILPFLSAAIAYVPAIVFVGIAALVPDERLTTEFLPTYGEYYAFVASALVIFTALVAPEALCPDRRTGLFGLYLASPLTRTTYLVAKAGTVLALLLVATLGPPLLMLVANVLQGLGPDSPADVALLFGRVVLAGLELGVVYAAVSIGVSSLTDRKALASAGTLLVLVLSGVVSSVLVEAIGAPDWVLAFNLGPAPTELAQRIHGEPGSVEYADVATAALVGTWLGWTALGLGVAGWRYRITKVVR